MGRCLHTLCCMDDLLQLLGQGILLNGPQNIKPATPELSSDTEAAGRQALAAFGTGELQVCDTHIAVYCFAQSAKCNAAGCGGLWNVA
jgi:hypothetical protein